MRTKIWLLLLIFACGTVCAQVPPHLQTDVKKLYSAFDEIDLDKLSVMILSPSDPSTVYDKLDAYFQNNEQKFRNVFTNAAYHFSEVKVVDGKSYCAINFRNVVRVTYFKPIDVAEIQKALKEKFNAQSIVYEKARNSFLIVYNARMVASLTNDAWQFAFLDNTLPQDISEGSIPENIKKALGL